MRVFWYLRLYQHFLMQHFKTLLEYRANFLLGVVSLFLIQVGSILTLWVIMQHIPDLNGWKLPELLIIYGLLLLAKSLSRMFSENLWLVGSRYVRTGDFDRFLLYPINPLFHLLAERFSQEAISEFVIGTILLAISFSALAIPLTFSVFLYLIMTIISGALIFFSLNLVTATTAFWIIDQVSVMRMVFDLHVFAQYPLTIYPNFIRFILTWVIPFGFVSFYPSSFITNKTELEWWFLLSPLVAVVALSIAYRVWLFGLKCYTGTGS